MTQERFFKMVNQPLIMGFYLMWKLPMAWFAGIRVNICNSQKAEIRLPYGWRSQNPFKSTYFAAQCAAGELSTGLLALAALQDSPPVSMLVVNIEAVFFKKASATLNFTCEDGDAIQQAIRQAIETGVSQVFVAKSTGRLPDGLVASEVRVTWSFKAK
jgi:hypothetical protein